MRLDLYRKKRNFRLTREPSGKKGKQLGKPSGPIFVIQEHHASRLHFDFRLEEQGVLKSWAITKEPTMDTSIRRLAIEVEDHPLEYAKFHGTIPKGEYGGGVVKIWDHGTFENLMAAKGTPMSISESMDAGHVEVFLRGERLQGAFALIRLEKASGSQPSWLFLRMKKRPALSPLERARRFAARRPSSERKSPSPGKKKANPASRKKRRRSA